MKKSFCIFFILFASLFFSAFAIDYATFKNPGDAKVYHSDGTQFRSETRPGWNNETPTTRLIEGDAIKTGKTAVTITLENTEINLATNSILALNSLDSKQPVVYLIEGKLTAVNNSLISSDREFIIITPVSRFSFVPPFNDVITSTSSTESINVNRGSALAYNYITHENIPLNSGDYLDFLANVADMYKNNANKINDSEIVAARSTSADNKPTLKEKITQTSKDIASSVSNAASKAADNVSKAVSSAASTVSDNVKNVYTKIKNKNVPINPPSMTDEELWAYVQEHYGYESGDYYSDEIASVYTSEKNSSKTETVSNNTQIEKDTNDKTDESSKESTTVISNEVNEVHNSTINISITSGSNLNADEKPVVYKRPSLVTGLELGVSSVFNEEMVDNGDVNDVKLFVNPYVSSDDFFVKLSFAPVYGSDETNTSGDKIYEISLPQIDFFKDDNKMPDAQKYITSFTQFVEDLKIGNFLYLSRNLDLPIPYSNITLKKHEARDNEYITHSYSTTGERVNNNNSLSMKLPFLVNFDTPILRFKAYTDDIENMFKYSWDGTYNWRREDSSVFVADFGFKVGLIGLNVGSIYMRNAVVADKSSDDLFLSANMNGKLTKNSNITISAILPFANYNTTYDSGAGTTSSKFDSIFDEISDVWNVGLSFNLNAKKAILNAGVDVNKGKIMTGLVNKKYSFHNIKVASDNYSLYSNGFGDAIALYPFMNIDFDMGLIDLEVNADIPIFMDLDDTDTVLANRLKSWENFDFLYRLNAAASLKIKLSNFLKLSASLSLDDVFPLRGNYMLNKDFDVFVEDFWTAWNLFPHVSFEINDSLVHMKISATQARADKNDDTVDKFSPTISFLASVMLDNAYAFNKTYNRIRREAIMRDESGLSFVMNASVRFDSAKYSDKDYTALTITPYFGFRHKDFSVIAKFDIENLDVPEDFDKAGDIVDTFLEEINIFNMFKASRISGINAKSRSVLYQRQYQKTLSAELNVLGFASVNIVDLKSFINGFVDDTKRTYFDASFGALGRSSFYLNYIANLDWLGDFNMSGYASLNSELYLGGAYTSIGVATTLSVVDDKFEFGIDGDVEDWDFLANVGFGAYSSESFALKLNLGIQNGVISYKMFDYLTQANNGAFTNIFLHRTDDGTVFTGISEFVDADLTFTLLKNLKLNVDYYMPFALFESDNYTGLLSDRVSAKLSLSAVLVDFYAALTKRDVITGNNKKWSLDDPSNFAFSAGIDFKAGFANIAVGVESAHFIYGANSTLPTMKDFSVNVEVGFGLM